MMITVDRLMALEPCEGWPRERVREFVGDGVDPGSARAFELLSSLPRRDACWLIARLLDTGGRLEWADACARRAKEYAAKAAGATNAINAANAATNAINAAQYYLCRRPDRGM